MIKLQAKQFKSKPNALKGWLLLAILSFSYGFANAGGIDVHNKERIENKVALSETTATVLKAAEEAGHTIEKSAGRITIRDGEKVTIIEKKGGEISIVVEGADALANVSLKVTSEYGEIVVKLENGTEVGRGGLNDGFIELTIQVKFGETRVAKGSVVFDKLYEGIKLENGADAIKGIKGIWIKGELGDNLSTFNELILTKVNKGTMTLKEAALETFTGKTAKAKGFDKVTKINGKRNSDGTYEYVLGAFFSN